MTLYSEGSKASSTNQGEQSITELWGAENSFLKNERELRRSEGSGMIINDPLRRGEQCWLDQQSHEEVLTRTYRISQGFADQNNLKTKEVPQKPPRRPRVRTISKAVLMNIEPDQSHHRSGLTVV